MTMSSEDASFRTPVGPVVPAVFEPGIAANLVAAALDGVALLDEDGRYLYVNPAGCRILRRRNRKLVGQTAFCCQFGVVPAADAAQASLSGSRGIPSLVLPGPDGESQELEYQVTSFDADGRRLNAVVFRDVSHVRRQQRRLAAFARAAHNVAFAGTLRSVLDAIAAEVVRTTGLAAAQLLIVDPVDLHFKVAGAANFSYNPDDFSLRLAEIQRRGGELMSQEAMRSRRPVVSMRRKERLLADPAWAPLHDWLGGVAWESFVVVPLFVRDRAVGAMNGYGPPGFKPSHDDIAFLTAMADQAAIAVEDARLFAESKTQAELEERHRIARDLHDSINQELFSITLLSRATELALRGERPGSDDDVARGVTTLGRLAQGALEHMRSLIFALYPAVLRTEGLVTVVQRHASNVANEGGLRIDITAPATRLAMDPDAEENAYRLILEALHNVVRHAQAQSVHIRLGPDESDDTTLLLELSDDGVGFDLSSLSPDGLGLVSMRERAERLGGHLSLITEPGAGTTVRVVAPRALRKPVGMNHRADLGSEDQGETGA